MKGRVQKRTEEEMKREKSMSPPRLKHVSTRGNYKVDENTPLERHMLCKRRGKKKRQEYKRWRVVDKEIPSYSLHLFFLAQIRKK